MTLRHQLRRRLRGKVVIVGMGNPARGDDAAGSRVVARLTERPGLRLIDAQEVPENVLGQVVAADPDTVVLIDAVDLQAEPGTVALVERSQCLSYLPSTHRVPAALLMRFLATETEADVLLLGIQPREIQFGAGMSSEVEASVATVATLLTEAVTASKRSQPLHRSAQAKEPV